MGSKRATPAPKTEVFGDEILFGRRVRIRREQLGLREYQLAARLGVPERAVIYLESGNGVSVNLLRKLARALAQPARGERDVNSSVERGYWLALHVALEDLFAVVAGDEKPDPWRDPFLPPGTEYDRSQEEPE